MGKPLQGRVEIFRSSKLVVMKSSGWLTAPKKKNTQKRTVTADQLLFPKLHLTSINSQQMTVKDFFANGNKCKLEISQTSKDCSENGVEIQNSMILDMNQVQKDDQFTEDVKEYCTSGELKHCVPEELDKDVDNLDANIKAIEKIDQQADKIDDVFVSQLKPKKLKTFHDSAQCSTSLSQGVKFLPVKDKEHTKLCLSSDTLTLHSEDIVKPGHTLNQFSCQEASDQLSLCTQEPVEFVPVPLQGTELDLGDYSSEEFPSLCTQVPTKLVNISRDNMKLNSLQNSSDILTLNTQVLISFEPLSIVGTELNLDN